MFSNIDSSNSYLLIFSTLVALTTFLFSAFTLGDWGLKFTISHLYSLSVTHVPLAYGSRFLASTFFASFFCDIHPSFLIIYLLSTQQYSKHFRNYKIIKCKPYLQILFLLRIYLINNTCDCKLHYKYLCIIKTKVYVHKKENIMIKKRKVVPGNVVQLIVTNTVKEMKTNIAT
jgi:hypothetical protein